MQPVEQHDPLWPEGYVEEPQQLPTNAWRCQKCGKTFDRSSVDDRFCTECYALEAQNTAVARRLNSDWMEAAKECGLALYEQQPEETAEEYRIWVAYRDAYPMRMPTWSQLAKDCSVSVARVTSVASKWSFKVRLQAWARFVDASMQQERIQAIQEMNAKQVDISRRLQEKLSQAVDMLDPATMKPAELNALLKTATDLERRIKLALPEKVEDEALETTKKQQQVTKVDDLGSVLNILQQTGLLQDKIVGLEQRTTVLVKEDPDATQS